MSEHEALGSDSSPRRFKALADAWCSDQGIAMLHRIPETEVMNDHAEAKAYDAMDHTQPNMAR